MDDLYRSLRAQLSERVQIRERTDLVDEALMAALVLDDEERSWALVRLAAGLRERGDFERALLALDGADLLGSDPARSAAFTCAAAIHCDRGNLREARQAGERARALHEDNHVLAALARIYHALWQETRLDEFHALWRAVSAQLEQSTAV